MLLTKHERVHIEKMKNILFHNPNTRGIIGNPVNDREISLYSLYKGKAGDQEIKSRLDIYNHKHIIVDLKSAGSIRLFSMNFELFQYDLQVGFYALNYENFFKKPLKVFVFIVCEKKNPYQVAMLSVEGVKLVEFKEKARQTLEKYIEWKNLPPEKLENKVIKLTKE